MPTPFYHLNLINDLRLTTRLPPLLIEQWPAFCFGNIAPDAQTLSGQTRLATHFFDVPLRDLTPAWLEMFRQFPGLANPSLLPPAQAAFVAGYLCHLALDQLWISDIFDLVFGEEAGWSTFQHRLFLHNVLRVYLDQLDWPKLSGHMATTLKQANPTNWLPFITPHHLTGWRDFIAAQLTDGAASQTVAVFAARMSLTPTDFESLLQSPLEMQAQVFNHLPLTTLADFRLRGLARCQVVARQYLT